MELRRQEAEASSSHRSGDHGGGGGGGGGGDRAGFDRAIELGSVDRCGSGIVGAPIAVDGGSGAAVVEVAKRKRGRPPRGGYAKAAAAAVVPSAEEEEDVCFICFDGGSLVLCDRRNCPKAYHPACIKRDEAFFKSRAKWNCGWHICSICMKASHYLCYTCTYSLCKGCTKDADYVCVRGNKGFCGTCKRTILLIENFEGNKEAPQVDFDDKTSWEYLFKVYWVLLKGNLSLSLDDLLKATNPWKPPLSASKWGFAGGLYGGIGDNGSVSAGHCPDPEVFNAKRRKINTKTNVLITKNSLGNKKDGVDTITHGHGATSWASKELLEFVAHMRNGDTSLMSQFDVQDLLLEYIKKNNLRDPHQKCQIVCDSRFLNMFGQARLDQIEMLKLLESHFLVQDDYLENDSIVSGIGDAVGSQMESGRCYENQMTQTTTVNDKRSKVSKSSEEKGLQINPNEYARIDVNNIKLIYLPRKLLENLLDGADKFNEKVVGSIVRIRVSTSDQKPDMHRLVRVVGTSADAVPYKIGTRETSFMLEILNLDKREVLALDKISNEEFSQDECERLRQSIKFGLIKRLTVGEIQEKARVLHEVILHDWLEAEISRLNNLRDQAIEKGHLKELEEYKEKLQNLNSAEERKRLLEEVPVVQSDPTMDPSYDFDHSSGELDRKKLDNNKVKPINSGAGRKKRESISSGWEGEISSNSVSYRKNKTSAEKRREDKAAGVNCLNASNNEAGHTDSGTQQPVNDWEMHKIWHYQDPTGKIQGPFFMLQLRKWSISGHFPPHLRVWRLNEKPEDSILLTDALDGLCSKEQLLPISCPLPLQEQEDNTASTGRKNNADDSEQNKSSVIGTVNGERVEQSVNIEINDHGESNVTVGNDGLGSNPSSSNTTNVANSSDGNSVNNSEGLDSLNGNHVLPSTTLQVSNSVSTPVFPENQMPLQIGEDLATERNSDHSENVGQNADSEIRNNQVSENHSDGEDQSGQSSGQNWRPPLSSSPTNNQDSNFVAKSLETSEQNKASIDFPTPNTNLQCNERSEDNKQPVVSSIVLPVQDAGPSWSTASSLVGSSALMHDVAGESGGYSSGPAKPSAIDEWESSLASASSLKPREIPGDNVTTPASISDHLTPSSPSHPHSNTSSWQDMLPDPDEFSSLLNESVSDLLAEVEAMESLHALSCHNVVNSGSKTDCISPVEGFSPAPEHGKGDAFSSTVDINLPLQSNVIDEPLVVVSDPDVLNSKKSSKAHQTSTSPEADRDTWNSEVSVNQWEASGQPPALPTTTSWSIEIPDTTWNSRSDSMNTTWNANMSWESGLDQGNDVMDWNRTASRQNTPHMSLGITPPVPPPMGGILGSQPRHGGDRYSPRDRGYHSSRDSPGFGRNRHSWNNRQQYFGSSGGGGGSNNGPSSFRAPAKGQRVCKFYESGYCKRGSSCTFLHP